jgi:hypothetical protein
MRSLQFREYQRCVCAAAGACTGNRRFKATRTSLGGLLPLRSQPVSSAGGSVPARHDTSSSEPYTCSSAAEGEGAASPLGLSTDEEEAHAAAEKRVAAGPPGVKQLLPPSSDGGLSAASSTHNVEDEQLLSGQTSPKRRWRVGKMDAELAGMRERLASLQALYQQQMLQRQLSPRRGRSCSSTDEQMQLAAQQAVAADAREAKRGRFASDDGGAAAKGLQVANATDSSVLAPFDVSSSSTFANASDISAKQEAAADKVVAAVQPELPPLPPGPVPAAALSKVAAAKVDLAPDASLAPAADATAATSAAVAAAEQPQELPVSKLAAAASAADEARSSPGLLAQLLSDSPDVPSPVAARSPSIDSTAKAAPAAAGEGGRGVPTPLKLAAVLDAAAAAAASPGCSGGSAASSSCTSPAVSRSPAGLQATTSLQLSDSMYRVSIGNSITAANNSTSLGGAFRSDSPIKWSLSLQVPLADSPAAVGATRLSPTRLSPGGGILSSVAQTPPREAAAVDDEQQADAAEPQSTEEQQQQGRQESGNVTAADASATAAAAESLQVSDAAVREGVTIPPHGQHVVWPGWGAEGAWEGLTPSPGSSGAAPKRAAAFDAAVTPTPAAAADAAGPGLAAEESGISAESSAAVVAEEPRFWLQQNPCYDMTPLGSTPGSAMPSSNGRASSWAEKVGNSATAALPGIEVPGAVQDINKHWCTAQTCSNPVVKR